MKKLTLTLAAAVAALTLLSVPSPATAAPTCAHGTLIAREACARAELTVDARMRWTGRYDNLGHGWYCFEVKNTTSKPIPAGHRLRVEGHGVKSSIPAGYWYSYCADGTDQATRHHVTDSRIVFARPSA